MLYYVIDAFTEPKFGGNPAGVVIHENLDEKFMQKFAAEVRFSETAFIKKIDNKNFEIKFFTPTSQVNLCGMLPLPPSKHYWTAILLKIIIHIL